MKKTPKSNRIILSNTTGAVTHGITRRQFLRQSAGAAAGLALSGIVPSLYARGHRSLLPKPQKSGIEHIVLVMMENRSFDHFLGWLPEALPEANADGRQAGLTYTDRDGVPHQTYPLGTDYQGFGHPDPDHSYDGGRVEYNGGACDGWLRAGLNDEYAIGYYTQNELLFFAGAVPAWTTCDAYFSAIMASTYPNRIYQHAAQTDRLDNSILPSTLPTIWDRLAEHSLTARYYYSDVPFLALWGTKYIPISALIAEFFADCAAGTLPHVSFVEPRFLGAAQGLSNDDHPFADIRNGQAFLNTIYTAVTTSPNWKNTVLIINYDEWGGFFEHVPPTVAPIPPADAALGSDGLRGFRVPALIISPWSTPGKVAKGLYDHTSVLRLIEWRWHLRPLTVRDRLANNIASELDFANPDYEAPAFTVPPGPFDAARLGITAPSVTSEYEELAAIAKSLGFE